MTGPSGPGRVMTFWPGWTRTLDSMIASLARIRSRCGRCHVLLHVDPEALRVRLGGSASLIDRSDPCAVVGCGGDVHYLGAPATGTAYHVLVADPGLLAGVIDPVGLPFRSRWQDMVAVGSPPLPGRAPAAVIALHPHIAIGADERIS